MTGPVVHRGGWADLHPVTAYALLKLRVDVFVVEQACPYPELDGLDVAAGTEHVWTADRAGPTAYLRVLDAADGGGPVRIGRVVTRADARGAGLAGLLVRDVLERHHGRPAILSAQAHLGDYYRRFGFAVDGPQFVEDGIPHLPMRREPAPAT